MFQLNKRWEWSGLCELEMGEKGRRPVGRRCRVEVVVVVIIVLLPLQELVGTNGNGTNIESLGKETDRY